MIVSNYLKELEGVRHGFFTRQGGVSRGIYASLNCGYGSGDDSANVRENRLRVTEKLSVEPQNLVTVRQVHSPKAVLAEALWRHDAAPEGDAIVTTRRGLAIGILSADCTPVLFADAEAGVIGAAHAGWRGARGGVIETTLAMMEQQGAQRDRIWVAIGPTISQKAYEVGEEFREGFLQEDEANEAFFVTSGSSGKPHFDLPGYCLKKLQATDVEQVDSLGLCTYGDESLFFSYRRSVHREEPDYGRQISAIVLL